MLLTVVCDTPGDLGAVVVMQWVSMQMMNQAKSQAWATRAQDLTKQQTASMEKGTEAAQLLRMRRRFQRNVPRWLLWNKPLAKWTCLSRWFTGLRNLRPILLSSYRRPLADGLLLLLVC